MILIYGRKSDLAFECFFVFFFSLLVLSTFSFIAHSCACHHKLPLLDK